MERIDFEDGSYVWTLPSVGNCYVCHKPIRFGYTLHLNQQDIEDKKENISCEITHLSCNDDFSLR